MLEKGIVLELKEEYAIVLRPDGAMLRIKRKDGMQVGDQIYILPEDHDTREAASAVMPFPGQKGNSRCREKLLYRIAGLAAAVVLLVTLALYPGLQSVCAVASFDGEQDLQLELDHRCRIVNGYSYGALIPEEEFQSLRGKKLSEVGDELTALMGKGPVLIGYASCKKDAEGDAQTEQMLRDMFSNRTILYLSGDGEDIELAESTEISLGFHLVGEVVDDDTSEVLNEFLEAYMEYQEELEDILDDAAESNDELDDLQEDDIQDQEEPDSEDEDFSYLDDMDFDELLDEIQRNPSYEGNEDVLELLADKMEELHEEHKEQNWDSDDDESDDIESDEDD